MSLNDDVPRESGRKRFSVTKKTSTTSFHEGDSNEAVAGLLAYGTGGANYSCGSALDLHENSHFHPEQIGTPTLGIKKNNCDAIKIQFHCRVVKRYF
jgi:hypothetical protein